MKMVFVFIVKIGIQSSNSNFGPDSFSDQHFINIITKIGKFFIS